MQNKATNTFTPFGLVAELKNLKKQVAYYKKNMQLEKYIKTQKRKFIVEKSKEIKRIASLRRVFNFKMKRLNQAAYEWDFKD